LTMNLGIPAIAEIYLLFNFFYYWALASDIKSLEFYYFTYCFIPSLYSISIISL